MRKKTGVSVTARLSVPERFFKTWEELPAGGRSMLLSNLLAKLASVSETNSMLIPCVMTDSGKGEEKWTYTVL